MSVKVYPAETAARGRVRVNRCFSQSTAEVSAVSVLPDMPAAYEKYAGLPRRTSIKDPVGTA